MEIVRSRRTVNRLHENKAQLNSISMHLGESVGKITYLNMCILLHMLLSKTATSSKIHPCRAVPVVRNNVKYNLKLF